MEKKRILAEIKRLAAEGGGKAPGRERFEKATGIRMSDWYPHLWLRWGDALTEAGFRPNTLTPKTDRVFVIEKYIALTEELGRVPLHAELRLKAKSDSTFPSHSVFSTFGDKASLISAVRAHCEANPKFSSVLSLLPSAKNGSAEATSSTKVPTGYVYLMKSGRHFKIGRSNSVGRRQWELGIKIPIPPTAIHSIETDDPVGVEAYWHRRFAEKRGEGEWFSLTPQDIAAFKKWKKIS